MEWAKEQYNKQYDIWVPWLEDLYLRYFTKDNKASYATRGTVIPFLPSVLPVVICLGSRTSFLTHDPLKKTSTRPKSPASPKSTTCKTASIISPPPRSDRAASRSPSAIWHRARASTGPSAAARTSEAATCPKRRDLRWPTPATLSRAPWRPAWTRQQMARVREGKDWGRCLALEEVNREGEELVSGRISCAEKLAFQLSLEVLVPSSLFRYPTGEKRGIVSSVHIQEHLSLVTVVGSGTQTARGTCN
ncbi:hypothetical protein VTK73DRAFT_8625 [Phialemonium thermophilum]|uniref:Uncharacterized protein n=1 Tax=Phialemonium thermophilum TaxID=223376 RepID=A0ABR3W7I0_9PEZI